jgi:hypothetical protein
MGIIAALDATTNNPPGGNTASSSAYSGAPATGGGLLRCGPQDGRLMAPRLGAGSSWGHPAAPCTPVSTFEHGQARCAGVLGWQRADWIRSRRQRVAFGLLTERCRPFSTRFTSRSQACSACRRAGRTSAPPTSRMANALHELRGVPGDDGKGAPAAPTGSCEESRRGDSDRPTAATPTAVVPRALTPEQIRDVSFMSWKSGCPSC